MYEILKNEATGFEPKTDCIFRYRSRPRRFAPRPPPVDNFQPAF